MSKRKGQSTLEYVLVLTAIIGVVAAFVMGAFRSNTQTSLNHVSTQMQTQVQKISYNE